MCWVRHSIKHFLLSFSLNINCGLGRKEGYVLFNDALNTFYLRLYGVIHMVKDHSESERGNPLPPHGLLFPISSKGFFYMHHHTDRIAHTTAFVTPVVEHWLERELWVGKLPVIMSFLDILNYKTLDWRWRKCHASDSCDKWNENLQ